MSLPREHFLQTKKLIKAITKPKKIGEWLLECGYYPEKYVLPPSFDSNLFKTNSKPYFKDEDFKGKSIKDPSDPSTKSSVKAKALEKLLCLEYPKSSILNRNFGIQHPKHFHDLVQWIIKDWGLIVEHLYHPDQQIYSYSFPIPIIKDDTNLIYLRSGRMIYEWIEMAEKDLVAEAHNYNFLVRADITNFYNSIYTHSIGWALHGRQTAFDDKKKMVIIYLTQ